MNNTKTIFKCRECGNEVKTYAFKCLKCKAEESFEEVVATPKVKGNKVKNKSYFASDDIIDLTSLTDVPEEDLVRFSSGIRDFDTLLGGGFVVGSVSLLSGDPGIGKSTLLLQVANHISQKSNVLYISGEESKSQIKGRFQRLDLKNSDNITVLSNNNLTQLISIIEQMKPKLLIIDSIQTMCLDEVSGSAGSVSQIKECAAVINQVAKRYNITTIIIGHITKDGTTAGPKILEHLVDATFFLEGSKENFYRFLRSFKNRFGTTDEIGIFSMESKGLVSVPNPSELFLSDDKNPTSGVSIFATQDGNRTILVEIQALVTESLLNNPRRVAVGVDYNRLSMLIAILQKHCNLILFDKDVYLSSIGGFKINETGADLSILISILTSVTNIKMNKDFVAFGEVDLTGQVRNIVSLESRIKEAVKLGYNKIILPKKNKIKKLKDIEYFEVSNLNELLNCVKLLSR